MMAHSDVSVTVYFNHAGGDGDTHDTPMVAAVLDVPGWNTRRKYFCRSKTSGQWPSTDDFVKQRRDVSLHGGRAAPRRSIDIWPI
jgi:hypothetical protein